MCLWICLTKIENKKDLAFKVWSVQVGNCGSLPLQLLELIHTYIFSLCDSVTTHTEELCHLQSLIHWSVSVSSINSILGKPLWKMTFCLANKDSESVNYSIWQPICSREHGIYHTQSWLWQFKQWQRTKSPCWNHRNDSPYSEWLPLKWWKHRLEKFNYMQKPNVGAQ